MTLAACGGDVSGSGSAQITALPRALTVSERAIIGASNGFGLELAARVTAADAWADSRDFGDPATLAAINAWVEEQTGERIDSIVGGVTITAIRILPAVMRRAMDADT